MPLVKAIEQQLHGLNTRRRTTQTGLTFVNARLLLLGEVGSWMSRVYQLPSNSSHQELYVVT